MDGEVLHLQGLPQEILLHILSFVGVFDIFKLQSLSKRMLEITNDDAVWFGVCRRRWSENKLKELEKFENRNWKTFYRDIHILEHTKSLFTIIQLLLSVHEIRFFLI